MALAELVAENAYTYSNGVSSKARMRFAGGEQIVYVGLEPKREHLISHSGDGVSEMRIEFGDSSVKPQRNSQSLLPVNFARILVYTVVVLSFVCLIYSLTGLTTAAAKLDIPQLWKGLSFTFLLLVTFAVGVNIATVLEVKRKLLL